MHSKKLLAILFTFVAACAACTKDPPPDPVCELAADGAACNVPGDCCSGNCANNVCVVKDCAASGATATCTAAKDCCSGYCDGTCGAPCALKSLGETCNAGGDCCSTKCGAPSPICVKTACEANGVTCASGADCCSGSCGTDWKCTDNACQVPESACTTATAGTCCSKLCANSICLIDNPKADGAQCTYNSECASGSCTNSKCGQPPPPPPPCKDPGVACTNETAGLCCSKVCDTTGHCGPLGKCKVDGKNCETNADCCSLHCSDPGVNGATCLPSACRQVDESCSTNDDCCTGACGTDKLCDVLPPGVSGKTCKVSGEACTLGTDCCSTNCQGGRCRPASSCASFGDTCWTGADCCSGLCGAPAAAGQPGRCDDSPGSCNQSGSPCTGPSNCCTRRCEDIGYGATVCKIPGGCVMTGDYCDSNAACCGGTNPDPTNPDPTSPYGVYCDLVGVHKPGDPNYDPYSYDPSSQDSLTCAQGQACNPTGNICGLDASASQNCCDGKKAVCKFDDNFIPRCFGCPNGDCTKCLGGIDGNDPNCCIPAGNICQFREQCCNDLPCVPDPTDHNILKCTPSKLCLSVGETCDPLAPNCCDVDDGVDPPLTCQNFEGSWQCARVALNCTLGQHAACTPGAAAPDCCVAPNTCKIASGATTYTCESGCAPKGETCTNDGDCCTPNTCDPELMRCYSCQGLNGVCSIDADCCSGKVCDVPSGQIYGTCQDTVGTCTSFTGQPCNTDLNCCTTGDKCLNQGDGLKCTPTGCRQLTQQCGVTADTVCCAPGVCYAYDANQTFTGRACAAGDTNCLCRNQCANTNAACNVDTPCCSSSVTCLDDVTSGDCTSGSASCRCRTAG